MGPIIGGLTFTTKTYLLFERQDKFIMRFRSLGIDKYYVLSNNKLTQSFKRLSMFQTKIENANLLHRNIIYARQFLKE